MALLVTGWVVYPVVHQLEHASHAAEYAHEHVPTDGIAFQGNCPPPSLADDECFVCQNQQQFAEVDPGVVGYQTDLQRQTDCDTPDHSQTDVRIRSPRGPPAIV